MKPNDPLTHEHKEDIGNFIRFLIRNDIQLLCLDYDLTVCCKYTYGTSVPRDKTRALFVHMHEEASKMGLNVCITTFHPMVVEVQAEVARTFGLEAADLVVKSQTNTPVSGFYFQKGKIAMIEAAWKEIFPEEEPNINKTFLIDDHHNNIAVSHKRESPALWFNPEGTITDFLQTIQVDEATELKKYCQKLDIGSLKAKRRRRQCILS